MKPVDATVLPHLRPAARELGGVVGSGVVAGLLTVVQAFALGALVVGVVEDPSGSGWHPAAAVLAAVVALRVLAALVGEVSAAAAAVKVSSTLRTRLLTATRAPGADGTYEPVARVVLATRGVSAVEPYVTRFLPALVPAVVLPVVTLAAVWWLDWLSGLIIALTLPLIPVFAALVGMTTRERAARQWRAMGVLSGYFLDVVAGLPTLVAHRRARAQVDTIRTVTHRYRRATVDTLKVAFASSSVLELVATLSVALVAVTVGLRLAGGSLDFRVALTVLLLAPEAYWPLRRVGAEFHAAAEGTAALAEADEVLASTEGRRGTHRPRLDPPVAPLALDSLEIGHRGGPSLVTPLGLALPARGLVAVTGPSGCGKSTLLDTLRGRRPPLRGRVTVGGTDLADVDPVWWRAQVAWAPQRPWLAGESIAHNLRLGRPEATDAELWEALDRVGLIEPVRALAGGLDDPLGEDGAGLSAGQRARVALARVVLARRPVVMLDEPSAHLDAETEAVLLETLTDLARHSLVVVVAHRAAVVARADLELPLEPFPTWPARPDSPSTAPPDHRSPVLATGTGADLDEGSRWGLGVATLLGAASTASGVALTATAGWLITRASEHPPVLYLMVAIVGVRLFGLARPVLRHAERVISHDVVLSDLADRRATVYERLVPLVPGRLGPRRGDLLTQVVDDVDSVLDERLRVRQPLATSALVGTGAVVASGLLDPLAGAVVLAVVAAGPLVFWGVRRRVSIAEPAMVAQRALLGARVEEVVHGLDDLEQWQAIDEAVDRVDVAGRRLGLAARRSALAVAVGHATAQVAAGLGVVAMATVVPPGAVSSAMMALLLLLPLALVDATSPLADAGALSVRTAAARHRLDALAETPPAVVDPGSPRARPTGHGLALESVSVGWTDERPAFRDLDLSVRAGEHVGVTGPSGSGKSTLAAALMRYLDPVDGRVLLDGVDLRELCLDDVRTSVGLVDDDPHVFASTVVENVRLARPEASDDEVLDALRGARLGDWVGGLPEGVHTRVGAGARTVSGGERARLELARALLAQSPVLVLDEPTAHLDTATARAVARDLLDAAAGAGRSIVWITHGTVGLARMDRVVDLDRTHLVAGALPGVGSTAPAG